MQILKAVAQRFSVKKVFLEILQNSQKSTFARVSFLLKLHTSRLQLYLKRDSGTGVFLPCEFCKISKDTFSYRTLPMAASEIHFI